MSHRRFDVWSRAIAGIISLVSPARAARYLHGRVVYQLLAKRGYAAASSRGPNQLWSPVDRTAEDDIRIAAPKIRARARDLARNNPNLAGAIATIVYNVVGSGIVPQADVRRPDGSPDAAMNDQIEDAWRNWSDAGCDLTGELTFPEIEELTARHLIVDGEIFHHYVARDYLPGAIPLRLESIEADRIDALNVAGNMVNGIEYNGFMVKTAYHVFESNYGVGTYQSHPIPADEMLHIYHKQRASQFRGISWLAPIIMRLYDLSEYEDYEMIGAKLAAAFGVFIETPFSDMPVRYMGDQTAADSESPLEYIEPGRIQRLMPGEKVSVASHNRPGSNFDSFIASSLRAISAGLNISYEAASKDYRRASYSSARSAALEERRFYRWCQAFLIRRLCQPVYRRVLDLAVAGGKIKAPGYVQDPGRYQRVRWQTPGWEWVDPLKDSRAAELELKLGIISRRDLAWQRGRDLDQILTQLADEKVTMTDLGLIPDSANGGTNE